MSIIGNHKELDENTNFKDSWTLWEFYKMEGGEDYHLLLKQVLTTQNMYEFARFWSYISHAFPSRLFFNTETKEHKKFEIQEDSWKIIESLCWFRSGIHPSFEDENNDGGIGLYYVLENLKEEQLDLLWMNFAAGCAGEDFNLSDKINGIRLVDKCTDNRFLYRVEIWMREDISGFPEFESFKNQINTLICDSKIGHFQSPLTKSHKVEKKKEKYPGKERVDNS